MPLLLDLRAYEAHLGCHGFWGVQVCAWLGSVRLAFLIGLAHKRM